MKAMSNSDFARAAMDAAKPAEPFEPTVTYETEGDCMEFIAAPDDFYAERIDDLVTVYYSRKTGEIIGSLIKNVSVFYKEILAQLPGFVIEVRDGKVRLQHLFRARAWARVGSKDVKLVYEKLIEVAEKSDARAELCHV